MKTDASSNYLNTLFALTKRNMLLFLKSKLTVFFSLLAPVLIFLLYSLFLSGLQLDAIGEMLPSDVSIDDKAISGIFNSWMLSGVVAIACLTVGLNSMLTVISDKETKTIDDFRSSPVSPVTLQLSYFLASAILTLAICLIVLILALIYLAAASGIILPVLSVLELFLTLFLSCLSSAIIMMCLMSVFKTNASVGAFSGIFSALIGFLTGAYLPVGILPYGIQVFAALLPASHSTALFRSILTESAFSNLPDSVPSEFIDSVKTTYAPNLSVFGAELGRAGSYLYLASSILVFFAVYLLIDKLKSVSKRRVSLKGRIK